MSRNGTGGYSLPTNSWNPSVNGVSATAADWQTLINDIAAAIQQSVSSDGQTTMTGALKMGGNVVSGLNAPTGAGESLRWEQLVKGADIASAAAIAIPNEGTYFDVTGSTAITSITDTFPGKVAYLKFAAGITLAHSASLLMPAGVSVTTELDDVCVFINDAPGVWRCVSYPRYVASNYAGAEPTITWPYMTWADTGNMLLKRRNAANSAWIAEDYLLMSVDDRDWASIPVGGYKFIEDHIAGVAIPPVDNPHFRYIKLTAGDDYNSGVLTSESVSGSAPLVMATAVVSLAGSPMNGATVRLLNTERRSLRPGIGGTLENDAFQGHKFNLYGGGVAIAALGNNVPVMGASTATGEFSGQIGAAISDGTNGTPRIANETRFKGLGVPMYRRIK